MILVEKYKHQLRLTDADKRKLAEMEAYAKTRPGHLVEGFSDDEIEFMEAELRAEKQTANIESSAKKTK